MIYVKSKIYLLKIQVWIILSGQLPELRVHSERWLRWNLLHAGILTFAACISFCGDPDERSLDGFKWMNRVCFQLECGRQGGSVEGSCAQVGLGHPWPSLVIFCDPCYSTWSTEVLGDHLWSCCSLTIIGVVCGPSCIGNSCQWRSQMVDTWWYWGQWWYFGRLCQRVSQVQVKCDSQGLGSCCVLTTEECGGEIKLNRTYIQRQTTIVFWDISNTFCQFQV